MDKKIELEEKLREEPRWCYECNTQISVWDVDGEPMYVCSRCQKIMDGYIAKEKKLVQSLQLNSTLKKYLICDVIDDIRRHNPLIAEHERLEKENYELKQATDPYYRGTIKKLQRIEECAIGVITSAHKHINGFHYISDEIHDDLVQALADYEKEK